MTLKEVIEQARSELSTINVPAAQINNIGIPLVRVIDMLSACVEAMENAEKAEEKGASECSE